MKLMYSPTSPYARKVRVVARIKSLLDDLEEAAMCPFNDKEELLKSNPLGKVPALLTNDGHVIYDSDVICNYLNSIGSGHSLWLEEGESYWIERTRTELGNGIIDSAFALVMERKRPEVEQSQKWKDNYRAGIISAAAAANADINAFRNKVSIDTITLGCALAYVDFRLPDLDWRAGNQELEDWFKQFSRHSFMQETAPPQS